MDAPVAIFDHSHGAYPTIPEFYRGRKIFITGGSGFMGKVLVEKLLRSCPDLDTIYLLLRPKKGKTPSSRVKVITDTPLFDKHKNENPTILSKIHPITGDVKELGLGLSLGDKDMLQNEVSVIFHCAASVSFNDPIKDAVLINVRGTREVINLALGMKNLKVFLHLSTTFCNFDQVEVEEEIYPQHGDWKRMIRLVEQDHNDQLLTCLTPKIIGNLPNTYTFAKSLAEHVIKDHQAMLPIVILRPSIVMSSVKEPMPGWIDNFNGPVALYVAAWKGLMSTCYVNENHEPDFVPVDTAVTSMVTIAWHRALSAPSSLPVYNCSSMFESKRYGFAASYGLEQLSVLPVEDIIWRPSMSFTLNPQVFLFKFLFQHMIYAAFLDSVSWLMGKKVFLTKLHRKIYSTSIAIAVFADRNLKFHNEKFLQVNLSLHEVDKANFDFSKVQPFTEVFCRQYVLGVRQYLLKEPLSSLPRSRLHYKRMYWLDRVFKTSMWLAFLWIVGRSSFIQSSLQRMNWASVN